MGSRTIYSGCNYHVNGCCGDYWSVFDIYQSWETVSCHVAGFWYPFKDNFINGEFQWPSVYFVCIFTIEKLLYGFVVIVHKNVRSLSIVVPLCYSIIDAIGFLFSSAPFLLGVCECVGEKYNWRFLAIVFLWQLSSTRIIWGICVYYVVFWRILVVKDKCFFQSAFEGIECCMVTWCLGKFCMIMGKGCERFCYPIKILDELVVVTKFAKECSYLFSIFRGFQ